MRPLARLLAAVLAATISAPPAQAQIKAIPELAAPVGGGVSGAPGGAAAPNPTLAVSAPSLNAPLLTSPAPGVLPTPSPQASAARATASPAVAQAALPLPAAAAPAAPPKARPAPAAAQPRTQAQPQTAAPLESLDGLQKKTEEMGQILGEEGGGARAGEQAGGVAASIFDGGLRAGGAASLGPAGAASARPAPLSRPLLKRAPPSDALRREALSAIGAEGLPVFDSVSREVLETVSPEATVMASVESRRGGRRRITAPAAALLDTARDPETVSIRVTAVDDAAAPLPARGLSKFKDGWFEELPKDAVSSVYEAVVTFASGEAVRAAGSRAMLLDLAARDEVLSLEYGEGVLSMRRVSEVPPAERLAGFDRAAVLEARLGPGILTTAEEAGISGMRVHHGTLAGYEPSIRSGPKNMGKGFGGRGLYVAVDGDRSIAEFFASKAESESRSHLANNPEAAAQAVPPKALVMDGTVNAERPLRVGRFQVNRDAVVADLSKGVLPADWDRDPTLSAMMERAFDVLDLRGMRSGGLAIDTDRFLVFHERAGADAILWDGGPAPSAPAAAPAAPGALARAYGRLNLRLGRAFYAATGGSFGILPQNFGQNTTGDPLIILERKTPPFSQLLPASLRPAHFLSIGVNDAPDMASKKALIKAFGELGSAQTLERLGIGRPGGPRGFKVVTENTALASFAERFEDDGWRVLPYREGAGTLDRVQHWLQHPYASLRRLAEGLLGRAGPDPRRIIIRDFAAAGRSTRALPPASR